MLTEAKLRKKVYDATYKRGSRLYNAGGVLEMEETDQGKRILIRSRVQGSGNRTYQVELLMDESEDKILDYDCECPANSSFSGMCKHCVATLLSLIHQNEPECRQKCLDDDLPFSVYESRRGPDRDAKTSGNPELDELLHALGVFKGSDMGQRTEPMTPVLQRKQVSEKKLESTPGLQELLRPYLLSDSQNPMKQVKGEVILEPHLSYIGDQLRVTFKIGITQKYVLKDLRELLNRVAAESNYQYGKKLEFVHREEAFTEKSRQWLAFIRRLMPSEQSYRYHTSYYYGYQMRKENELEIDKSHMDELMELLEGEVFYGSFLGCQAEVWAIKDEMPDFGAVLKKKADGAIFTMRRYIHMEGEKYLYFPKEGMIRRVDKALFGKALGFFCLVEDSTQNGCNISGRDLPIVLEEIIPELKKAIPVKMQTALEAFLPDTPEFQFYLDMPQRDLIVCKGYALYGEERYPIFSGQEQSLSGKTKRSWKEERQTRERAAAFFTAYNKAMGEMALNGEKDCYEFLTEKLSQLKEVGEVFISDKMKAVKIRPLPQINVGLSVAGNLLNLTLDTELPMTELAELLSKYDRKKKYYRLKNGEFIQYDQESLNSVSDMLKALQVSEKTLKSGEIEAPRYRALYLDEQLKEKQGISVDRERSYKSLIRNMKSVEDSDFELPDSLKKVLRGYQKKGFFWLKTLCQNSFGGILADDMGLGKTLQVIAFLLSSSEEGETKRSLIISPASLVYNWESEIRRFAPALPVRVLAGSVEERTEILKNSRPGEILVTSYETMRRDQELYKEEDFFCEVIDEAQYIKNAGTKGARAVKSVSAQMKLALTGTPVENRLSELWSIFDYLMPGFLYSYEHFKKTFEAPIMKKENEEAMANLQKMIRPFILRRLKKEVLSDLPDKIEKCIPIPLAGEQKKLYDAHVQRLKFMLESGSNEDFGSIRMQVLAELTRLRQLCCDPELIYQDYKGGAAKVELCMELLNNAVNGGHKILLFSQFTSMLDILEKRMDEEGISYYSLTGSTPKKERMELMQKFNQDEISVFCISLKAGGTGLNLTGADMVIHYDPWWNVAAENQATDRAHRIGQKRVVTVYKLVAEHTIEEKVLELQQKKKELADQVLSGEEMGSVLFDREELLKLFQDQ